MHASTILGAVLAVALACGGSEASLPSRHLDRFCRNLAVAPDACRAYVNADPQDRSAAAEAWAASAPDEYACSGLKDASCVEEDIATRALPGFSACQPAPPGKRCHGGAGACTPAGCAPRQRIPQQPWQQQQQNGQQQQDGQQEKDGQQQQQHRRLLDASTPNDAGGGSGSGGAAGGAGSAGRWYDERFVDGYNYLRLQVGTTPSKARVLPNFLGTSHEWGRLYEYARTGETLEAFAAIFRELGPNPVLRIGGRSQELLKGPPSDGEFEALRALSSKAGARFIVGLPLEPNDVGLAKSVMGKADAVLGPSILGFGLGNEPDMWESRIGGYDSKGQFTKGFPSYLAQYHRVANALTGCTRVPGPPLPWVAGEGAEVDPSKVPTGASDVDGDGVADTLEFGGAAGPVGGGGDAGRTYDAWGGVSSANAAGGPAGARSLGGSGRRLAGAGGAAGGRGGGGGGGRRLADVAAGADGRRARFIGPSWHDLKLTPFSLQTMARTGACYLRELSVHYYSYFGQDTAHVQTILDESRLRDSVARFSALRTAATDLGLGLRITETNSAVNGGRSGLSETFGAALWTADAAFEFARAGATGMHLHWGVGGDPQTGGPAYVGVQTNYKDGDTSKPYPSVHAPWYGYLLFAEATRGDYVRFTYTERAPSSNCEGSVKVWSLIGDPGRSGNTGPASNMLPPSTLRVAIINKDADRGCNVELRLPNADPKGHAELHWLWNSAGITGDGLGVMWRGQTYSGTTNGKLTGRLDILNIAPAFQEGQDVVYKVAVPAGTAALLVTAAKIKE